jgi:hypothetical protein
MTPEQLTTVRLAKPKPPVSVLEQRFGKYAKGTVLPETRKLSCPPRKVSDFPEGFLKQRHIEALEQNQKIASCCRHPENHTVEGYKSHPDEPCTDIYEFICTCGRRHRFFCVGLEDVRPEWK